MKTLPPNILAMDIGNSQTKVGIFRDGHLIQTHRFTAKGLSTEAFLENLAPFFQTEKPAGIVYGSVVPDLAENLATPLSRLSGLPASHIVFCSPNTLPLPIDLNGYPPEDLGSDRLANLCAAQALFPNQTVLVVDFGTATTWNLLDATGKFLGGAIAPGLATFWDVLSQKTGRLPRLPIQSHHQSLGMDTIASLTLGLSAGYTGLYGEVLAKIKTASPTPPLVVGTGGLLENFLTACNHNHTFHHTEPTLTLLGLYNIYCHQEAALKHNVSSR